MNESVATSYDGIEITVGSLFSHEDGTRLLVTGISDKIEDGEHLIYVEKVFGPTDWCEVREKSLASSVEAFSLEEDHSLKLFIISFDIKNVNKTGVKKITGEIEISDYERRSAELTAESLFSKVPGVFEINWIISAKYRDDPNDKSKI